MMGDLRNAICAIPSVQRKSVYIFVYIYIYAQYCAKAVLDTPLYISTDYLAEAMATVVQSVVDDDDCVDDSIGICVSVASVVMVVAAIVMMVAAAAAVVIALGVMWC